MTGLPTPQRARTKTAELSDIFRSSHSSRHVAKDARSVIPVVDVPDTPPEEKHKYRRSMLPFLGRKKTERPSASSSALPKKSTSTPLGSFGKASSLTVASTTDRSSAEVPLPSTLPPLNVTPPSLGSKFAAHFTPLRSPSKTLKARYSSSHKSANITSPTHSSTTLSPQFGDRGPSPESRGSSVQSRSTTPRPFRQHLTEDSPRYDVEEDFSDLFIRPKQTKSVQKASNLLPVIVKSVDGSKKSAELPPIPLTPTSPTPPSTPRLQFPIPPSGFGHISLSADKSLPDRPQESSRRAVTTPSSKHSDSSLQLPATNPQRSSISHEHLSNRGTTVADRNRARAFSLSGSDTDASRATDSSAYSRTAKHQNALPKASALKRPAPLQRAFSSSDKLSSGPPPSVPLPSPPPSAALALGPSIRSLPIIHPVNSAPSHSSSPITSRPRANTVSTTALSSSKLAAWMAPKTTLQNKNITADVSPPASMDELQNALALQSRKYAQLQEYAVTITKKFEDEKVSMAKTIQMLEREIRKKVREIEGLRWLVIHNGGADDIDAAANLARASLVTLDDGDRVDSVRVMGATHGQASSQSPITNTLVTSAECDTGSVSLSLQSRRGLGLDSVDHLSPSAASLEPPSSEYGTLSASSSRSSLSLPVLSPSTPSSLSAIPEQPLGKGEISRAERQKAKEERRAIRALRGISSSSMSSAASGALIAAPPLPNDPTFDPQHNMDNVLEKLRPFRNT